MATIVWTIKVTSMPPLEFEPGELDTIDQALRVGMAHLLTRPTGLVIIDCSHELTDEPPA